MRRLFHPGMTMLALLLAGVLSGCTRGSNETPPEQRALERWNFLIAHQADKAYDYLTPGYRETVTREKYANLMNHRPTQWKGVSYTRKECEADRCSIYLAVSYEQPMGGGNPVSAVSPQKETWLRLGGVWYHLPSN
jgi:hypothetical protein